MEALLQGRNRVDGASVVGDVGGAGFAGVLFKPRRPYRKRAPTGERISNVGVSLLAIAVVQTTVLNLARDIRPSTDMRNSCSASSLVASWYFPSFIESFIEKPAKELLPEWTSDVSDQMKGEGKHYLASMGIYVFNRKFLLDVIWQKQAPKILEKKSFPKPLATKKYLVSNMKATGPISGISIPF